MTQLPASTSRPTLRFRAKSAVSPAVLRLPPVLLRLLAGRPVSVDGQVLDTETQVMLRLERAFADAPRRTVAEGRAWSRRQSALAGGRQRVGAVDDLHVRGADGPIAARLYTPSTLVGTTAPGPIVIWFHGGAMVYGDLDTHDPLSRMYAEESGARVLLVDYRLAPEHPFPAGVDDAVAAYRWVLDHAADVGADPQRIAVGGDSAGGYLAAAVAIQAANLGLPLAAQLLLYPVTDLSARAPSYQLFGNGEFPLTTDGMAQMRDLYAGDRVTDPRASVLLTDPLPPGLAPAIVATAGFDVLRDEGLAYAAHLRAAGASVEAVHCAGFVHGFAHNLNFGRSQRRASVDLARRLGRLLG